MDWRTITIFVEPGKDITIDLHGEYAEWELEAILMRAMEKVGDGEVSSVADRKEKVDGSDEDSSS